MRKQRFLLTLLAALIIHPAWASITLVQKAKTQANNTTTISATLSGVAANDFISVIVVTNVTGTVNSVADPGNTVSTAVAYASTGSHAGLGIYYVAGASSGAHTITVTWAANTTAELMVAEYSGVATSSPLDAASAVAFGTTNAVATASITPTVNGELIVFGLGAQGTSAVFSAFTNGFTEEDSTSGTPPVSAWAQLIQGTSGTISAGATQSNTAGWAAAIAAFKPGGTPPTVVPSRMFMSGG